MIIFKSLFLIILIGFGILIFNEDDLHMPTTKIGLILMCSGLIGIILFFLIDFLRNN